MLHLIFKFADMAKKSSEKIMKGNCFVIMPFRGWFDEYYSKIYCPAIVAAGLKSNRADDLYAPNNVVSDIWKFTKGADIVLADLTGKNPNVFYELGLAHAISKPVILITESEEDIPFDLRAIRIIKYDKNEHDWGKKLEMSITKSINEILKDPTASIPAPFLSVNKSEVPSITKTEKDIVQLKQEVELLKKEVQTNDRIRNHEDIGPLKALKLIEGSLKRGVPENIIISSISRLGPPESWIEKKINEFKLKN